MRQDVITDLALPVEHLDAVRVDKAAGPVYHVDSMGLVDVGHQIVYRDVLARLTSLLSRGHMREASQVKNRPA